MQQRQKLMLASLFFLILLLALSCRPQQQPQQSQPQVTTPAPEAAPLEPSPVGLSAEELLLIDALGLDFAERRVTDVYERTAASVVNINTRIMRQSLFYNFQFEETGSGSGFVLDEAGHILTNFHVVQNAQVVDVTFGDDTVVPARIVGSDRRNDIALLRVEAPPELLVPVSFGDSRTLRVGQRAIAIGNPFGQFQRTLTTGVISGLERSLQGPEGLEISGIIQTDAAINRGNSGGPLLDSAGRVIGMNTAIFSPSGTSAGVGFAVPSATIERVLPDLLTLGRYRHPWLGVHNAYRIEPRIAADLRLPVTQGLLLIQVLEGSPLAQAGVRGAQQRFFMQGQPVFVGGDILTSIDGVPVTTYEGMRIMLENRYRVGDSVEVTLLRGGQPFTVTVTLTEEPPDRV